MWNFPHFRFSFSSPKLFIYFFIIVLLSKALRKIFQSQILIIYLRLRWETILWTAEAHTRRLDQDEINSISSWFSVTFVFALHVRNTFTERIIFNLIAKDQTICQDSISSTFEEVDTYVSYSKGKKIRQKEMSEFAKSIWTSVLLLYTQASIAGVPTQKFRRCKTVKIQTSPELPWGNLLS